jgi:UDP-N-acetylglucosamine--N-acetylmuramyl-(pentapeptide) pyrophosphoryl-undecaprenol N-acetylglucosamine transferase
VYPALTVLKALQAETDPKQLEVLWIGGVNGMEADLVKRASVPFRVIPAAGVHGVGLRMIPAAFQLLRGFFSSRKILKTYKPDVLFFTGGYIAVPMALASRITNLSGKKKVPSFLFVPDIEPGLALKVIARFSNRIAVINADSRSYFPPEKQSCIFITGYPTRPEFNLWDKEAARRFFNLESGTPSILVFGGSKGARSINQALVKILPELLQQVQVVHISGNLDWEEVDNARKDLSRHPFAARYHPFPYLHDEMGAALASADLVISRAGASTLGEYPLFSLPSVLVPYPHAWRYQKVNAEYLAGRGAAVLLEDHKLDEELLPLIHNLFNQPEKLAQMGENASKLHQPQASRRIVELVIETANHKATPVNAASRRKTP